MAFPVTGKFKVSQADEVLTVAYGQIIFKQKVRSYCIKNLGAVGDSDVVFSLNGTDDNGSVQPGDVYWSEPLIDGWYYDIYVKSSAAVLIPNYEVMSSEK